MGRWECSRTTTVRESKSGWVIGILGWIRATPRWVNVLVWKLYVLVQRQGTPRWADETLWWIYHGLVNLEGLGGIHNNKRQILGFE